MRRIWWILGIIAVLVVAGLFLRSRKQAAEEAQTFEIVREAQVARDTILATVNATGSIEPEAEVALAFGAGGTVKAVNIVRGQSVTAGQVLAVLDADELALAVQQAQDALRIQELTLQQRMNSEPSAATLTSAQADIDSAEANLSISQANLASAQAGVLQAVAAKAQLQAGGSAADISASQADIAARQAENELIHNNYQSLIDAGIGGPPEENLRAQVKSSDALLLSSQARLASLQAGPRSADIQAANAQISSAEASVLAAEGSVAVAEANITRAQASHDRLLEPPTDDEIAILEAQIASGRTNLAITELRLSQAQIVAPIDGIVASIIIKQGEQASPGQPVITILNQSAYHLEVNVDEIDIDQIALTQSVEITLDALPDNALIGEIADIAPQGAGAGGGVVTYLVTINIIEDGGLSLRPGMTANATIVTREIADVLIVPNWAIKLNRDTGEAFVNRFIDAETVEEVTITTGLRNEQFSELLSGLSENDTVVITNEREEFSLFGGG